MLEETFSGYSLSDLRSVHYRTVSTARAARAPSPAPFDYATQTARPAWFSPRVIWITASCPPLPLQCAQAWTDFPSSHQPQTRRRRTGAFRRVPTDRCPADGCRQFRRRHLGTVHSVPWHVGSLRNLHHCLLHSSVALTHFPRMDGKILFRILHHQRHLGPAPNRCRRSGVSRRPLHPGGHAGKRGSGRTADSSSTLPRATGVRRRRQLDRSISPAYT